MFYYQRMVLCGNITTYYSFNFNMIARFLTWKKFRMLLARLTMPLSLKNRTSDFGRINGLKCFLMFCKTTNFMLLQLFLRRQMGSLFNLRKWNDSDLYKPRYEAWHFIMHIILLLNNKYNNNNITAQAETNKKGNEAHKKCYKSRYESCWKSKWPLFKDFTTKNVYANLS